ncbi:TolC family protein, partial [Pyxidicoccus sp. 3LG]
MLLTFLFLVALPDPFTAGADAGAPSVQAATSAGITEDLVVPPAPALALASWDDALARLRARSVDLQLALAQLELAGAETRLALSPLLPSVSGSLSLQERLVGGGSVNIEGGGGNVNVGDGDEDEPRPTSPLVALRATATQAVVDVPAWMQLSAARARERAARAGAQDAWRLLVR